MSRHSLTDFEWQSIRPFLPKERSGKAGRPWKPHRQVINGILFVLRTGIPWADLSEEFGKYKTVYNRFRRWVKADAFYRMFKALAAGPDFEYAMIDGSIVKVHRAGQGAKGGLKARL